MEQKRGSFLLTIRWQNNKMKKEIILIFLFFVGLFVSAIHPHDYFTWALEVFPALIALAFLALTYKKYPMTNMVYTFILVHCYILFIGGHYTYAEVPLFNWIKDTLHQSRNNYDKVGHFAQGFIPAMIVREVLIRKQIVKHGFWLAFLTLSVCVTVSAFYEFLEWGVSLASGSEGDSFLGTQGYVWDTQSDMLYCTIGALTFLTLLSKYHTKKISNQPAWP